MENSIEESKIDIISNNRDQVGIEDIYGIEEKAIPPENPRLEAIEYFVRDARHATKIDFWEAFNLESIRLAEKKVKKLRTYVEEHKLDESRFSILSGEEAVNKLDELNLGIFMEEDLAKEGILIFELPDAVSKRWWRGISDGESAKLMPWGNVYESVVSVL